MELPPPMSLAEVENMTLAQKKMAAMIMEGREDEVENGGEGGAQRGDEGDMDMEDDEEETPASAARNGKDSIARAQANASNAAPMKIRKDYVPKCKLSVLISVYGRLTSRAWSIR